MKKMTRFLTGTLIAILLLGTAATAAACGQQEAPPTVTEVTEPQSADEVIPAVDRQEQLAAAKEKNPDTAAWLYIPGAEVDDPVMQARTTVTTCRRTRMGTSASGAATMPTATIISAAGASWTRTPSSSDTPPATATRTV